jgi:hypothetical protein
MKNKLALVAVLLGCSVALAQEVPNHAVPIGTGPGGVGFRFAGPCPTNEVLGWASGVTGDPTCVLGTGSGAGIGSINTQTGPNILLTAGANMTLSNPVANTIQFDSVGGTSGPTATYGAAIGTTGVPVGGKDPATGFMQPFLVDPTGNVKVNVAAGGAAGGTSSNFAAAFPGPGTAVGATDGTLMRPLNVDSSGNLKVNVAVGASGGTSSLYGQPFPVTGTAIGASDGINMRNIKVDSNQNLLVRQSDGINSPAIKGTSTPAAQTDAAIVSRSADIGTITDTPYAGSGNTTVVGALKGVYSAVTSPIPGGSNTIGNVGISGAVPGASNSVSFGSDPCTFLQKTNQWIGGTVSGSVQIIALVTGKRIFICSMVLMASGATSLSVAEGQGASCAAPNQVGILGVATNLSAANGMSFPASGGLTLGNGTGSIAQTTNTSTNVCLYTSSSVVVGGNVTYVAN